MKTIILTFILSITIHILFLYNYKVEKKEQKIEKTFDKKAKDNKSTITYVKLAKPKPIIKEVVKPKEQLVQKEHKKELKKVPKKIEAQKKEKKPILPIKKEAKKQIIKEKPDFKKVQEEIKPQERRKSIDKKSLENFLLSEPVLDKELLDEVTKSYLKLYGEEYNKFTKVQKAFLQNSLKKIGEITQKYLYEKGYPRIAVKTGQQGVNVVEFFLYPNGDIKDLKIINSSSYATLDKNTIETIEIAYKDYPRPKEVTKIRIYVYYRLY